MVKDNFPPRTLAIDFGTKRIGLAVSSGSLAEPLEIIANDDQVFKRLAELCQRENIEQLIVGVSEQAMADKTLDFVNELKTILKLPLELVDETLSSQEAISKTREGTIKQSRRSQPIDHFAAAGFLQEWLDQY